MGNETSPKYWSVDDVRRHLSVCFYQAIGGGATSEVAENTAEKIVNGQTIIEHPDLAILSIQYAIVQGDELIASFDLGSSPAELKQYLVVLRNKILMLSARK